MGSSKATPAKASTSAAEAHHRRASSPLHPPTEAISASTPTSGGKRARAASIAENWNFTHVLPDSADRAKNGRCEGRNLITWNRPRMTEKLLLHIQYECSRFKVELPWDNIAHRLHPGSSGGAVLQHLNRVRHQLVAEGHLVPPICQKPGSRVQVDQNIRGYVRRYETGEDTASTRPVRWDEPMDDRRFNLPDSIDRPDIPTSIKRENMGGVARKLKFKKEASPDPADLDSDADYVPAAKPTPNVKRRSSRSTKININYVEEDNDYSSELYGEFDVVGGDDSAKQGDDGVEEHIAPRTPTSVKHAGFVQSARQVSVFRSPAFSLPGIGAHPAQASTNDVKDAPDNLDRCARRDYEDVITTPFPARRGHRGGSSKHKPSSGASNIDLLCGAGLDGADDERIEMNEELHNEVSVLPADEGDSTWLG
ncbi:hypothetical protein NKR23_g3918 [Pleurostoma richardsiae]|uniref:Uncharacterized protein n=1 Tax=Pleurostoma richardsiae TaxID=41990 RepID=A0AA38RWR1_9PEZI|nr:hypothetical protein NKR23_g3918 [Pleurostoma richardsiae]